MYLRLGAALMIAMVAVVQLPVPPEPDPLPMPPDRATDSYEIYSVLLDQGVKNSSGTLGYWLVNETTTAEKRPSWPCKNVSQAPNTMVRIDPPHTFDPSDVEIAFNDPHNATPPVGHKVELVEVLKDFDLHCHERVTLSADAFHTTLPVHLYKERFTHYPTGVAGITSFSEIYFDTQHTRALVHQGYNCGDGCSASQGWKFLKRTDGHWTLQKGFLGYVDYSP